MIVERFIQILSYLFALLMFTMVGWAWIMVWGGSGP